MSYSQRKKDHISLALKDKNFQGENGLSKICLIHEALPELNWDEISTSTSILGRKTSVPFFVSAMTGGFSEAVKINLSIAGACAKRGWMMGVGSQRKGLKDPQALEEWVEIKNKYPEVLLLGNLGISQLIHTPLEKVETLVRSLGAVGMVIHTNILQECLQPEGTPQFKGGLQALKELSKHLSVPVILKETGCGFSYKTLKKLCGLGLKAVDVSGYGGTHWGRIEGDRISSEDVRKQASLTYSNWGYSTLDSLLAAHQLKDKDFEVWASGGIKTGLDSAKCLALGASAVGFAHIILKQAQKGEKAVEDQMFLLEHELKIALLCTGSRNVSQLKQWEYVK